VGVCGLFLFWIFITISSGAVLVFVLSIPFALIFYTLGWRSYRKMNLSENNNKNTKISPKRFRINPTPFLE